MAVRAYITDRIGSGAKLDPFRPEVTPPAHPTPGEVYHSLFYDIDDINDQPEAFFVLTEYEGPLSQVVDFGVVPVHPAGHAKAGKYDKSQWVGEFLPTGQANALADDLGYARSQVRSRDKHQIAEFLVRRHPEIRALWKGMTEPIIISEA